MRTIVKDGVARTLTDEEETRWRSRPPNPPNPAVVKREQRNALMNQLPEVIAALIPGDATGKTKAWKDAWDALSR